MKKKNVVMKLALLGIGSVLMMSCASIEGESATKEAKRERLFGLEAMSGLVKASSFTPSSTFLKAFSLHALNKDPHLDSIQSLLPELDLFLENGFETSSVKTEGTYEINSETYSYQEEFSFKDIEGKDVSYSLFYNEIGSKHEKEDDEEEVETFYKGVASMGMDTYYPFESKSEIETEIDEREESMEFTIWMDKGSYISIGTSFEEEGMEKETELEFKVVEGGKILTDYSIEIEKEGEREKVEFEQSDTEYQLMKVYSEEKKAYLYQVTVEGEDDEETKYVFEKVLGENGTSFVLLS